MTTSATVPPPPPTPPPPSSAPTMTTSLTPPPPPPRRWSMRTPHVEDPSSASSSTTASERRRPRRKSIDVLMRHPPPPPPTPLSRPSSLKATTSTTPFGAKLAQYVRHHWRVHDSGAPEQRHVHFPTSPETLAQEFDRPETTDDEKTAYHYSKDELGRIAAVAKEDLARESRFGHLSADTILEQGYLTFPREAHVLVFHHPRRYYCLLYRRRLVCYASAADAARDHHRRAEIAFVTVQECATMSMQAKIAAFGAHLPTTLGVMFFITRADGHRVLVAADNKTERRHWTYALTRLTQVHEILSLPPPPEAPPKCLRDSSTSSTTSTCVSEDDEEEPQHPEQWEQGDRDMRAALSQKLADVQQNCEREQAAGPSNNVATC